MKRFIYMVLVTMLLLLGLACAASAETDPDFRIQITQVSAYGNTTDSLKLQVYTADGSEADYTKYYIAPFIKVGVTYWIKGYTKQSGSDPVFTFSQLNAKGSYSDNCTTHSSGTATEIQIYLLPMTENEKLKTHDITTAQELSLCWVKIQRPYGSNQLTMTNSWSNASISVTTEDGVYTETSIVPFDEETEAVLYPSVIPAYGVRDVIEGVVDGEGSYYVTVGLQMTASDPSYLKPNAETPYVKVADDGAFNCDFISNDNDVNAKVLTLYLVPASYVEHFIAIGDFSEYNPAAFAVDTVTITRSENGEIALSPYRTDPSAHTLTANIPISSDKIAVNVGFYTVAGTQPNQTLTEEHIRAVLNEVANFAHSVRFYCASGTIDQAYTIANEMGFKVFGTASLSKNETENKKEMNALIALGKAGKIDVAIVGNETRLGANPTLTEAELLECIAYVREGLKGTGIPITTSDGVSQLADSQRVRYACDIVMPNVYPYWGNCTDAENGLKAFNASMQSLAAKCAGKQIIVSETMWPTQDNSGDLGEIAAAYFDGVQSWSLTSGIPVLFFEAADEPWKKGDEGSCGDHWGILNTDLTIKNCYLNSAFFSKIYSDGELRLPQSCTAIDSEAFRNCINLRKVYIPDTVTTIAEDAFDGCTNLTIVASAESAAAQWAEAHDIPWTTEEE